MLSLRYIFTFILIAFSAIAFFYSTRIFYGNNRKKTAYAGDFEKFEDNSARASEYGLISGYAFVAGSDNALFKRSIILKGEKNCFIIKAEDVYRPDLEMNLDPEEYALMTGFCVKLNLKNLPQDIYTIASTPSISAMYAPI